MLRELSAAVLSEIACLGAPEASGARPTCLQVATDCASLFTTDAALSLTSSSSALLPAFRSGRVRIQAGSMHGSMHVGMHIGILALAQPAFALLQVSSLAWACARAGRRDDALLGALAARCMHLAPSESLRGLAGAS
jgi:hypothetical protein